MTSIMIDPGPLNVISRLLVRHLDLVKGPVKTRRPESCFREFEPDRGTEIPAENPKVKKIVSFMPTARFVCFRMMRNVRFQGSGEREDLMK